MRSTTRYDAWRHYHTFRILTVQPTNFPPLPPLVELPWMNEAACLGLAPDEWFPRPGEQAEMARKVCASCEVQRECLAYALDNDVTGVWGGTTDSQRRQMKKKRTR